MGYVKYPVTLVGNINLRLTEHRLGRRIPPVCVAVRVECFVICVDFFDFPLSGSPPICRARGRGGRGGRGETGCVVCPVTAQSVARV